MRNEKGFTLLELIISLGAITTMSVFAIQILSNQLSLRQSVEFTNEAQRQVNLTLERLSHDLRNAFLAEETYLKNFPTDQLTPPLFQGDQKSLAFMSRSYRSFRANEAAGRLNNLIYQKKENPLVEGEEQWIRYVDLNLTNRIQAMDKLSEQVLIDDLKDLEIGYWDGSDFLESWDSEQKEQLGVLPKMIRLRFSSWIALSAEEETRFLRQGGDPASKRSFFEAETIVYLPWTKGRKQIAPQAQDFPWFF